MKRKCNFRRRTNTICEDRTVVKGSVVPEVSKNQGSFQGIFYCILFRKTARKYFPSRYISRKGETRLRKNLQLILWKDLFNFTSKWI